MITLPPLRPGRPPDPDLAERRGQMQAAVDAGAWKTAQPPLETTLAGRRCLRFKPEGAPKGYMLQLHGGGFRIGRPEFESMFAEALAKRCHVEVVVPQYRLAPEGPFPAGLTDALECLKALRTEVGDAPLIVGGDSAGGGLAASLGVLCAGEGPRIDGLVMLSPAFFLSPATTTALRAVRMLGQLTGKLFLYSSEGSDIHDATARRVHPSCRLMPLIAPLELLDLGAIVKPMLSQITQPTLVMHAKHDHTCPIRKNLDFVMKRLGSPEKRAIELEESFHVITVDSEKERVASEVTEFVERFRLAPAKRRSA